MWEHSGPHSANSWPNVPAQRLESMNKSQQKKKSCYTQVPEREMKPNEMLNLLEYRAFKIKQLTGVKREKRQLMKSPPRTEFLLYFLLMSPETKTGFRESFFSYELRCSQVKENKNKWSSRMLVIPKWVVLISWRQSAYKSMDGDVGGSLFFLCTESKRWREISRDKQ